MGTLKKHSCLLGKKNKEGIRFVQGRFNMGSTGSITFCTRAEIRSGMYKFILSKKNDYCLRWSMGMDIDKSKGGAPERGFARG